MLSSFKLTDTRRRSWTTSALTIAIPLLLAGQAAAQATPPLRVVWWAAPTAEIEQTPWTAPVRLTGQIVASVPGALLLLGADEQGRLFRSHSLAADPSAPFGFVTTDSALAAFDRQKGLRLWNVPPHGAATLRWRRLLAERAASLGWDGGERLFVATYGQRLQAFAADDGRELWASEIDGKADAPPLPLGSLLLVATKSNSLEAFDSQTGRARWKTALPGPVLHPLAVHQIGARSVVLCAPWSGYLLAIEGQTGAVLWEKPLSARVAGAPLVVGDTVLVPTEDGTIQAFALDGAEIWKAGDVAGEQTSLLLDRGAEPARVLAVSSKIVALSADSGAVARDYPAGAIEDLKQRFANAMIEGERTYSEAEKQALLAQGAFDLSGPLLGAARASGPLLTFGTEEGWAYLFDRRLLRPLWRLHQGPAPAGPATAQDERLFVSAGEEVLALDRRSGERLWRRNMGSQVMDLVAGASLAVIAHDRASLLSLESGAPERTWRGRFLLVDRTDDGWLLADDAGRLLRLSPSGAPAAEEAAVAGPLSSMVSAVPGTWVAARRDGTVVGVLWGADAKPGVEWEHVFDAPPKAVLAAGRRTLVQLAEKLVCLDGASPVPLWEADFEPSGELLVGREGAWLGQIGQAEITARSLQTGEVHGRWPLDAPSVGAIIDSGRLVWWDRLGRCHQLDLGSGEVVPLIDVGRSLERATPREAGWIVTSSGGEVAWVEGPRLPPTGVTEGEPQ